MNLRVRPRVKRSDFLLKFAKPCSLLQLKMRRKLCQNIYIVSVIGNYMLDCKTVRIFAYSSTREQSNKRSGMRLKTESETVERR